MNIDRWDPMWFHSFCTNAEIERIRNPKTPKDFILRERADIVANNMRYERVYMNKARMYKNWSFEKSFCDKHYTSVLKRYTEEDNSKCNEITFGDMFSNDVNGYAWKDKEWGRIISLNESLQFYMKFCNLALFEFDVDVPMHVRINAMRIAIRLMLKQESMDFLMDPRGIVPEKIGISIHEPIKYELQYIAGHEFAHHLCGHLNDQKLCQRKLLTIAGNDYYKPIYNVRQKQEFEADSEALMRPKYDDKEYINILKAALVWFISLSLVEKAQDIIDPASAFALKTHPSAEDRYNNIIENCKIPKYSNFEYIKKVKENSKRMCSVLEEDLSFNYDIYDFYGSCYLDKPDSEWRGKELIDRVDYY